MINGLVNEAGTGHFRAKYFTEGNEDYALPSALDSQCFLTDRTMFNYVPCAFLDGVINHLEILKVFVGNRYCASMPEPCNREAHLNIDGKWREVTAKTRKEMMDHVLKSDPHHTEFGIFREDIFILAETDTWFWLLEYDPDVSDCCIGRFKKIEARDVVMDGSVYRIATGVEHSRDTVVRDFVEAVMNDADENEPPLEWLPEHRSSWYAF